MFKFNLDENIDSSFIEADYFYSIYQTNDFLEKKIATMLLDIECYLEDSNYFKEQIKNQIIIFLKDNFLSFVLVHEYEIAIKSSILEELKEEDNFKNFIILTSTKDWLEYFFEKYPIIKTRIENFINKAVSYLLFFLNKIKSDYSSFDLSFRIKSKIKDVKLFLGDLHNENKYVLRIDFSENTSLFFKPRNFYNEMFFEKAVNYYNQLSSGICFIIPKSISKEDYCWVSQLEYKNEFNKEEEVSDFFYNQGKLLFIFHLLGSTDIIPDNLIISNNNPGYFDLECLISKPKLLLKESLKYMFEESVMKIGMLPDWMINNTFERDILSSTFFALNSQVIKSKVWKKNLKNFEYINSIEVFSKEEDKHLPKLNNSLIELNESSIDKVIEGFTYLYDLTITKREQIKIFFSANSDFLNNKFRVILHPTSIYSLLYREINIPEYLQNKADIDSVIENLVEVSKTDNYLIDKNTLVQSIKDQIFQLDIPYYWFDAKGILYDGHNKIISNDWKFNSTEFIIERLENLSDSNLRFQSEIIRKSCELALEIKEVKFGKISSIDSDKECFIEGMNYNSKSDLLRNKLLKSAIKIGEALNNNLFERNDKINWISKVRDPTDGRYNISLLNYDLYDGQSGVALFYLYLHKYSKVLSFRDNALKIYNQLEEATKSRLQSDYYKNISEESLSDFPISPYSYPMSFVYLSIHIKEVLGDEYVNWDTIDGIFDEILTIIPQMKNCDYLLGLSGLVDFLLNMKKEINIKKLASKIDEIIVISLMKISNEADVTSSYASWAFNDFGTEGKNRLGGFSHGTAGISYVLFKASVLLKNEDLKKTATLALNFDRSFFDDEIIGWLDRRDLGETFDSGSWCHGSGGIGLGRLLTRQFFNDDLLEKEINIAKNNLLKKGFLGNQCICHGDFGNLEILRALNDEKEIDDYVWNYLDKLCDEFSENKTFKCGDGGQMELLGLFMGYSGFGYQMLRFYDWKNTPSVLCLETPNTLNDELHQ